jgi:hypothetical protein
MSEISTVGVLRLRATSAVARDKSVRRSAQDDDFVGALTKKHPKQVSAYEDALRTKMVALEKSRVWH